MARVLESSVDLRDSCEAYLEQIQFSTLHRHRVEIHKNRQETSLGYFCNWKGALGSVSAVLLVDYLYTSNCGGTVTYKATWIVMDK